MKTRKLKQTTIQEILEHRFSPNSTPTINDFWFEARAWIEDCLGVLDPKIDATITKHPRYYHGTDWRKSIESILGVDPDLVRQFHEMLFKETALIENKEVVVFALAAFFHHVPPKTQ